MSTVAAPPATILMPGDPGWDDARRAWNLSVDQHPAAVALPESAHDVAVAVRFARDHGLRVAAQGTGHNARPLGSLEDTVLVKTTRMRRVSIDPVARIARVEAGAVWHEVVEAAAEHGLAALAGSSPDVGVVGYTIGGGISWLGRAYGLAANNVEAIELVTADGRLVRADACTEPDLFWALRGGGGSFGVVTAIELRLFPITEVYAGLLWWPAESASEVLQAWRDLTQSDPPEEFTSAAAVMRFPAIPDVPGHLRGRSFAIITVIHLGAPAEADALLAPLRALGPVTDTVQTIPAAELLQLHMDPDHPVPSVADWLMLASLPAEAIEEFVRTFGTEASQALLAVELIHVGGEMKRARPGNGALAAIDADYALFAGGMAPTAQAVSAVASAVAAAHTAMRPVGGPADVPQPRRHPPRPGRLLDPPGLRPAAPHQGRGRPRRPDPLQPPGPPVRVMNPRQIRQIRRATAMNTDTTQDIPFIPAPRITTVAGYLLTRLAEAGLASVFGVPGDYNLAILDAIAGRPDLAWIGMATEQGAGYAADSYARLRGIGALVTTFGVGELSALNAIAGAYAESVPVVHIVGTPALAARETGATLHHNLPGRDYGHFARMAAEVTAAQADLRPDTAPEEIDRVLSTALRTSSSGLPHHSRRRGRDTGARPGGAAAAGGRGC